MNLEKLLKKLNRKVFGIKVFSALYGWILSKLEMTSPRFAAHKLDMFSKAKIKLYDYYASTINHENIKALKGEERKYLSAISLVLLPDPNGGGQTMAEAEEKDKYERLTHNLSQVQSELTKCHNELNLIKGEFTKHLNQLKERSESGFRVFLPDKDNAEMKTFTDNLETYVKQETTAFEEIINIEITFIIGA